MRFVALLDEPFLAPWQAHCLERLGEVATLTTMHSARPASTAPRSGAAAQRLGASDLLDAAIDVGARCAPIASTASPPDDDPCAAIDFAIAFGRAPATTVSALEPRFGVWRFQHELSGDALPFFAEVETGTDVTYAALVAHVAGRPPVVLEHGWFRTDKLSYRRQLEHLLTSISIWPQRVCRQLIGDPRRLSTVAAPGPASASRRPNLLRYRARIVARRARLAFEHAFRHPQWDVGLLHVRPEELLQPGRYDDRRIEWFPLTARDHFLADPFGVRRDGALHVFCEEFPYRTGRGHITRLDWPTMSGAATASAASTHHEHALELPVHMSYPFLIDDASHLYCVPETSQANEVALFECDDFPGRWHKAAVMLENFAGVDTTVFRYGDCWWLMCTERARDEDAALWIWHAPTLLGPWTPHERNPVKTDVRGARPGGAPFLHDGVLYRPTQDCSKHYGWRLVIQRVRTLTPFEFAEEPAALLEPSPRSPYPLGRHTLTPVGDAVLIDGHRRVFAWHAFRGFASIVARDFLARARRRGPSATHGRS